MSDTVLSTDLSLGQLIDQRADAYANVKLIEAQLKEAKEVVDQFDQLIMSSLEEQGLPGARGHKATMSIKETVVPNVVDWNDLYAYIKEHDYFHLLNRAPNAAAFRELFNRGDPIPGVESFTKKSLNFRSN